MNRCPEFVESGFVNWGFANSEFEVHHDQYVNFNPQSGSWIVRTLRYARYAVYSGRAVQGEQSLTKLATTPFVLSALRSKVHRSMDGVTTAEIRLMT